MEYQAMSWRLSLLLLSVLGVHNGECQKQDGCAVLASLQFRQHEAPTDILGVLKSVTTLINDESAVPVEDVEVSWLGDAIHAEVGSYEIVANVTHSDGKRRCYATLVQVLDTDECSLTTNLPAAWRHKCHSSAQCINTDGSYMCACESPNFAPLEAPHGCGGRSNTSACCGIYLKSTPSSLGSTQLNKDKKTLGTNQKEGLFEACLSSFTCLSDECDIKCARNAASCQRVVRELDVATYGFDRRAVSYQCKCPDGYVGTGRACPSNQDPPLVYLDPSGGLRFDADSTLTSSDEMPCGCQLRRRDPCAQLQCGEHARCVLLSESEAKCECLPGFTHHGNSQQQSPLQCVDDTLPTLSLRGPASVYLTQCGAAYDEPGVDVVDENAAAFERTLRIAYSDASIFPHRNRGGQNQVPYFKTGSYRVSYRVDTPWTRPPFVEAKRRVTVVDEDECALPPEHPCAHRCAPVATCVNELGSGYRCECPAGAVGDGFRNVSTLPSYWTTDEASWRIPSGFISGTGCLDIRPPTLTLLGANPRVLEVEKCDATSSLVKRFAPFQNSDHYAQTMSYQNTSNRALEQQVAELVRVAPHVLCDQPRAELCFSAHDVSPYSGESIDLTSKVVIGSPQLATASSADPHLIKFNIPYTVSDDAGNTASASRELIIRTLSLVDLQAELEAKYKQNSCPDCPKCPVCRRCPRPTCPACPTPEKYTQSCPSTTELHSEPCPQCPPCPTCPRCNTGESRDEEVIELQHKIDELEQRVFFHTAVTALAIVVAFACAVSLLGAQSQGDPQNTMPPARPPNTTPIRLVDTPVSRASQQHAPGGSGPYDSPYAPNSMSSRRDMMRNSSPWS